MKIDLPKGVQTILNTLEENGYKGYVVGGCVRDSLLSKTPKDWDITTDATPQEMMGLFSHINPTGLKHGTVTIIIDKESFETTTFRTEGEYSDGRRPDFVSFCKELKDDLSRRDFTINAMAYNDKDGLIDYFNGQEDLENGYIRCVGNPYDRFREDGLRILRAFRFRATLGFTFDRYMWEAIENCVDTLEFVSKERIRDEFSKIVMSNHRIIRDMITTGVMEVIIPDFRGLIGLNEYSYKEAQRIFEHTLMSMDNVEDNICLKLTMLFHAIGKLHCKTINEKGEYVYYSHYKVSKLIAEKILTDLKFENKIRRKVTTLVEYCDYEFTDSRSVKRCLGEIGEEFTRDLIKVKWSDTLASYNRKLIKRDLIRYVAIEKMLNKIIKSDECYSLKQLKINGRDLMKIGFYGKQVGEVLDTLLDKVVENKELNNEPILKLIANRIYDEAQK